MRSRTLCPWGRGPGVQKVPFSGVPDALRTVADAKLGVDAPGMGLDGAEPDAEPACDLLVRKRLHEQSEDLELLGRQMVARGILLRSVLRY